METGERIILLNLNLGEGIKEQELIEKIREFYYRTEKQVVSIIENCFNDLIEDLHEDGKDVMIHTVIDSNGLMVEALITELVVKK